MKNRINRTAINHTDLLVMGIPVTQANRDRAQLGDDFDEFVVVNGALELHGEELCPEDFLAMTADRNAEFDSTPPEDGELLEAINRSLAIHGEMI